ncbi:MAG TPA: alpha/beta hydrolase [Flavobacteriales bacterium]|nr:alpha/beta hydrolase [Flavobacteriales bacterium]
MRIYLLPGIGCDKGLFSRLELPGHDVTVLEWPPFPKGCTLPGIAQAMAKGVDASQPHVLVGVSMGGMVAQELALLTRPRKVVLISSFTGPAEWPLHARLTKRFHLWNTVNHFTMWLTWPFKNVLGSRPRDIDRLLWDMAKDQTAGKIRRGLKAIMHWKGSAWKGPLARIHGDNDHVIPLKFPVDHVIPGGEHIMVLTRAQEVSKCLMSAVGQ